MCYIASESALANWSISSFSPEMRSTVPVGIVTKNQRGNKMPEEGMGTIRQQQRRWNSPPNASFIRRPRVRTHVVHVYGVVTIALSTDTAAHHE
jgi:hypothetical protein